MAKFLMPPGCAGLTMEDGTKYGNYDHMGGTVEIERPDHVAAVKRSPNFTLGHFGGGVARLCLSDIPMDGAATCLTPGCRFGFYPWQTVCPRCGAPKPAAQCTAPATWELTDRDPYADTYSCEVHLEAMRSVDTLAVSAYDGPERCCFLSTTPAQENV